MTEKVKPTLEELIPFWGFQKYLKRCNKERARCYNLDGDRVAEFPDDYTIQMLIYNLIPGSFVGGSIGYLMGTSFRSIFGG